MLRFIGIKKKKRLIVFLEFEVYCTFAVVTQVFCFSVHI